MLKIKLKKKWILTVRNYQTVDKIVDILNRLGFDNREDLTPTNGRITVKAGLYWINDFSEQIETGKAKISIVTIRLYWWVIKMSLWANNFSIAKKKKVKFKELGPA